MILAGGVRSAQERGRLGEATLHAGPYAPVRRDAHAEVEKSTRDSLPKRSDYFRIRHGQE